MPRADAAVARRGRLWALAALALAAPACSVDATGAVVLLELGGVQPRKLQIAVMEGATQLGHGEYDEGAATIPDHSTFGVLLPDRLEGVDVQIKIDALDAGGKRLGSGTGDVRVAKHQAVHVTVTLARDGADGGVDMAAPDLATSDDAMPDLLMLDYQMPDLLMLDYQMPDLVPEPDLTCIPACTNGLPATLKTCCGNGPLINCPNGCAANAMECAGPDCAAPKDATPNSTAVTESTGAGDHLYGSCGGKGGSEAVLSFTVSQPSTVKLLLNQAPTNPVLYVRAPLACTAGAGLELPFGGDCTNAMTQLPGCAMGGAALVQQTLCGLMPGTYYAVVDTDGCQGGPISLTTTATPVALNDCAGAGMIAGTTWPRTISGDNRNQANNNQAPARLSHCGAFGASGMESVYYVPMLQPLGAGQHLIVQVQNPQPFNYMPLLYVKQQCTDQVAWCDDGTTNPNLNGGKPYLDIAGPIAGVGPFFIFVDSANGSNGTFNLVVSLQ